MKAVGRPSKYSPDVIGKIDEYIATTGKEQMTLPTLEGFSLFLDVNKQTLLNWMKQYPDFLGAIKKIEDLQKTQLMNDGMYGGKEINSAMAIFLLKVNHGMNEQPTHLTQINTESMSLNILPDDNQSPQASV